VGPKTPTGRLKEVERDIAGEQTFKEGESRLRPHILKDHPEFSKGSLRAWLYSIQNSQHGFLDQRVVECRSKLNPANAEAHKILALDCSIIGRYVWQRVSCWRRRGSNLSRARFTTFLLGTVLHPRRLPSSEIRIPSCDPTGFPHRSRHYSNLGNYHGGTLATHAEAIKELHSSGRTRGAPKTQIRVAILSISAPSTTGRKSGPSSLVTRAKAIEVNPHSDTVLFSKWRRHYRTQKELQKSAGRCAERHRDRMPR